MRNLVGDFELYVEGEGFAAMIESVKLPDLKFKRDDYVAAGMGGTREMGLVLEKMEIEFKTAAMLPQLLSTWGLKPGSQVNYKVMGSLIVPGEDEKPFKVKATGQVFDLTRDELKPGAKTLATYKIGDVTYYEETVDGLPIWEIDVMNLVLKNRGVDQMVARRRNLGRV